MKSSHSKILGTITTIAFLDRLNQGQRTAGAAILATFLTHDPLIIGLIASSQFVPWIIFGSWSGIILDSWSKVGVTIVVAWLRVGCALIGAIITICGLLNPWTLLAIIFVLASLQVVSDTAINVILPEMVHENLLAGANGRMTSFQSSASVLAPPLGSSIVTVARSLPFVGAALLAAGSAVVALRLPRILPPAEHGNEQIMVRLFQGFRDMSKLGRLRLLVSTVSGLNLLSGFMIALMPLLALTVIHLQPTELGLASSIQAIVMILGNISSTILLKNSSRSEMLIIFGLFMMFPGFIMVSISQNLWTLTLGLSIIGFAAGAWNVPSSTTLIVESAGPSRARIIAAYKTLSTIGPPLGALLGGLMATVIGIRSTLAIAGFLTLLVAFRYLILQSRLRLQGI